MELKAHICRYCGDRHLYRKDEFYVCQGCGMKFIYDIEEKKLANEIKKLADEEKMERVSALRHQLYENVNREYTDSEEIIAICRDLRSFLPEDFLACFYSVANGGTLREYAKFLNKIDAEENYPLIEGIVRFTIKSLQGELILPLGNLIERTYKSRDLDKYLELQSALEGEAERVEGGIYDVNIPRRAFIIYSSKDMDRVMGLVSILEDEGISCFVAQRNLQHGKGATQNYQKNLETAIDNCKCVVFVSSKNSRRSDCDAFRIELPYIKRRDKEEAPHEYRRGDYENLPPKYKKPRIEYMIELPSQMTAADRTVKEFFSGLEYCYSPEQVADRIFALDSEVFEDDNEELKRQVAELREQMLAGKKAEEQAETDRLRAELEEMKRKQAEQNEADRLRAELEEMKRKQAEQNEADRLRAEEETKRKQAEQSEADRLRAELEEMKRKQAEQNEADRLRAELEEMKRKQAELSEADRLRAELEEMKRKQAELSEADRLRAEEESAKAEKAEEARIAEEKRKAEVERLRQMEENKNDFTITNGCLKKYKGTASKVVIPYGVEVIADWAFFECESLTEVVIPSSVKRINDIAFVNCHNLISVTIPESVTDIEESSFSGCKKLANIEVNQGNSSYKSIDGSLYTKDGKTLIQYATGKSDTSFKIPEGVETIGCTAFFNSYNLTGIEIPNSVTNIKESSLVGCENLTNIRVLPGNTSYKSIDGNLYTQNGKAFVQYAIGKRDASFEIPNSVEEIRSEAFSRCSNITRIVIPNGVTNIRDSAFFDCKNLTSIVLPNSILNIGDSAFYECKALADVYYTGSEEDWNRIAFATSNECLLNASRHYNYGAEKPKTEEKKPHTAESTETRSLAEDCRKNSEIVNGCLQKYNGKANKIVIPGEVTSIGADAFRDCYSITGVLILGNVKSIGISAFDNCANLQTVVFSEGLEKIDKFAFRYCHKIKEINIPASVTNIGYSVFECCPSLERISVAEGNKSYKHFDGNLYSKNGTKMIQYAPGRKDTSFVIPSGILSIEAHAFARCQALKEITVPNGVNTIGESCFSGCIALQRIKIPETLLTIEKRAFTSCSSLEEIHIPIRTKKCGYNAFSGCSKLTIHVYGTEQLNAWQEDWNPDKRPIINDKTGKPAKKSIFGGYK